MGWSEAWHAKQGKHEVSGKERLRNRNNFQYKVKAKLKLKELLKKVLKMSDAEQADGNDTYDAL